MDTIIWTPTPKLIMPHTRCPDPKLLENLQPNSDPTSQTLTQDTDLHLFPCYIFLLKESPVNFHEHKPHIHAQSEVLFLKPPRRRSTYHTIAMAPASIKLVAATVRQSCSWLYLITISNCQLFSAQYYIMCGRDACVRNNLLCAVFAINFV